VSLSTRLAIESARITADVINVAVLPYLAVRHGVDDVPTTVVNGRKACVGVLSEDEFVRRVLAHAPGSSTWIAANGGAERGRPLAARRAAPRRATGAAPRRRRVR
jgi:hypothetical protein